MGNPSLPPPPLAAARKLKIGRYPGPRHLPSSATWTLPEGNSDNVPKKPAEILLDRFGWRDFSARRFSPKLAVLVIVVGGLDVREGGPRISYFPCIKHCGILEKHQRKSAKEGKKENSVPKIHYPGVDLGPLKSPNSTQRGVKKENRIYCGHLLCNVSHPTSKPPGNRRSTSHPISTPPIDWT